MAEALKFDSKEEEMFAWYLEELAIRGWIVEWWYHPDPIELAKSETVHVFVKTKKKIVPTEIVIANKHVYTPDFVVQWLPRAEGVFFWEGGGVYNKGFFPYSKNHHTQFVPFYGRKSYIDVKGGFVGKNNTSGITFPLNQKWVRRSLGIWVQKAVVTLDSRGIFARTFTPQRVIEQEVYSVNYKDKVVGESKLKYTPVSLYDYEKSKCI